MDTKRSNSKTVDLKGTDGFRIPKRQSNYQYKESKIYNSTMILPESLSGPYEFPKKEVISTHEKWETTPYKHYKHLDLPISLKKDLNNVNLDEEDFEGYDELFEMPLNYRKLRKDEKICEVPGCNTIFRAKNNRQAYCPKHSKSSIKKKWLPQKAIFKPFCKHGLKNIQISRVKNRNQRTVTYVLSCNICGAISKQTTEIKKRRGKGKKTKGIAKQLYNKVDYEFGKTYGKDVDVSLKDDWNLSVSYTYYTTEF